MDRTTRQLAGDIKAGRNLEQVLPELMNRMASAYGMLSYYNMNMELSVLLEAKEEGLIKPGRTVKELEEKLYDIMGKTLLAAFAPDVYEEAIKELAELRDKIITKMDILTAYTDLFILYEYVMNRLEAVFEETEEPAAMDNDAVAKEILQWIFSEEEPALVNGHIKEMVSCLPVRDLQNGRNTILPDCRLPSMPPLPHVLQFQSKDPPLRRTYDKSSGRENQSF
jgi:hypothetical protein